MSPRWGYVGSLVVMLGFTPIIRNVVLKRKIILFNHTAFLIVQPTYDIFLSVIHASLYLSRIVSMRSVVDLPGTFSPTITLPPFASTASPLDDPLDRIIAAFDVDARLDGG